MGLDPDRAGGSIRFSLGIYNSEAEVDLVLQELPGIIARLRALSPKRLVGMGVSAETG